MARAPRKTKAQLEAEKLEAAREHEEQAVSAIARAMQLQTPGGLIENTSDAARLVLLTIQAGKVPGVTFSR
jgi:hypothetical protein